MKSNIKSIKGAYKYVGADFSQRPTFEHLSKKDRKYALAAYDFPVVIKALNKEGNGGKDWVPNWNNPDEIKYSVWVGVAANEKKPSGFGFSCTNYVRTYTYARVGSRLCLISAGRVAYLLTQFKRLAIQYYLG